MSFCHLGDFGDWDEWALDKLFRELGVPPGTTSFVDTVQAIRSAARARTSSDDLRKAADLMEELADIESFSQAPEIAMKLRIRAVRIGDPDWVRATSIATAIRQDRYPGEPPEQWHPTDREWAIEDAYEVIKKLKE